MKNVMNKKTRIFLLIGLTKESAHWDDDFVIRLKELFQTDEVVGIDLPGAGKFLDETCPTSMEAVALKTRANYAKYFENNDFHNILISISLGGMVSTEWISHFPNDFDQFVIINSSFKTYSPVIKRVQPKAIKEFIHIFLTQNDELKEKRVVRLTSNNLKKHDQIYNKWIKILKERPMSKANIVRQVIAGAKFNSTYKPQIPTYIIAAKHDRLAHYSCSEKLYENWKCDFKLMEDKTIGHAIHLDAPEELAEIIYEWAK